jgi:hypothetical protein
MSTLRRTDRSFGLIETLPSDLSELFLEVVVGGQCQCQLVVSGRAENESWSDQDSHVTCSTFGHPHCPKFFDLLLRTDNSLALTTSSNVAPVENDLSGLAGFH